VTTHRARVVRRLAVRVASFVFCCAGLAAFADPTTTQAPVATQTAKQPLHAAPTEFVEIEKVIDGDTIHVQRGGKLVKLRLESVDTEEKFNGGADAASTTKPSTVFGEECAAWAQRFFADLAKPGEKPKVGLFFHGGHERLDNYGRLLCHVVLPDGADYNLMLVELGKSPYFNKYGNSESFHEAFVAAQKAARAKELGIWNPKTNQPATAGAPSAKRPYEKLLPWWDARATAIDAFRAARSEAPDRVFDADEPEALARALEVSTQHDVRVFGGFERTFDEDDGGLTVLLRSQDKQRALRVRIAKDDKAKFAALTFEHRGDDFVQNYLFATGRVVKGARGFELHASTPAALVVAGPEPVFDAPAR
jgi:micrococcal nuclease